MPVIAGLHFFRECVMTARRRTVAVLALGLTVTGRAPADQPAPMNRAAEKAPAERIVELKRRVAELEKELRDLKRAPKPEVQVKAVNVRGVKGVRQIAKALQFFYGQRPGFSVEVLSDLNLLLIRADAKTMEDAVKLVEMLR